MDTKQAQINVFTEGLNTDLHPLTTPNNILTDCINGTVITYNGNEFILQNDMGNYKLEKAKLPSDYIPVGVKEYGGIIYIVSYNPIDKLCQIGSYPSPQTLFDSDENSSGQQYLGIDILELDQKIVESDWYDTYITNSDLFYTTLSKKQQLIVLQDSSDLKNLYLNPGDKYWLRKYGNEEPSWKFQFRKYYSLSEDKNVYDITSKIKERTNDLPSTSEMDNVSWTCPGWVSVRPELYNINSFNVYVTKLNYPRIFIDTSSNNSSNNKSNKKYSKLSFTIQTQTQIYSSEIADNISSVYHNLIQYKCVYTDGSSGNWIKMSTPTKLGNPSKYGDLTIISMESSISEIDGVEDGKDIKQIIVRATPYIQESSSEQLLDGLGYIFDQYRTEYIINLDELVESTDISIFDTYKYLVNDSSVNVNFSINLPISTLSNNDSIKLRLYPLFKVTEGDKSYLDIDGEVYKDISDDLNLFGQNIITISYFNETPGNDENKEYKFNFHKENIYILSVIISDGTNKYKRNQLLITSELMNSFINKYDRYQLITSEEIFSQLPSYLDLDKSSLEINEGDKDNGYIFEDSIYKLFDLNIIPKEEDEVINNISSSDIHTKDKNPEDKISGYIDRSKLNINIDVEELKFTPKIESNYGKNELWSNINFNTDISNESVKYQLQIGGVEDSKEISINFNSIAEDENKYYTNISDFSFNGVFIDWSAEQEVVGAQKQYLIENIPWFISSDDNNEFIPQIKLGTNLSGWKNLYKLSIQNHLSLRQQDKVLGFTLSMSDTAYKYSVYAHNATYVNNGKEIYSDEGKYKERYPDRLSFFDFQPVKDEKTEVSVVKMFPGFRFNRGNAYNDLPWTYESPEDINQDLEWRHLSTVFDEQLYRERRPLFIPLFFTTHANTGSSSRGWGFPGGTIISGSSIWCSSGIGILYYSENMRRYNIANLELMGPEVKGEGMHITLGTTVDEGKKSSYLTQTSFEYGETTWFNNIYVASILLGLSLHIYSLKNINRVRERILGSLNDNTILIKNADLKFDRSDIITEISYNGVNIIKNGAISSNLFDNNSLQYGNKNLGDLNSNELKIYNRDLININRTWKNLGDISDEFVYELQQKINSLRLSLLQYVDKSPEILYTDIRNDNDLNSYYDLADSLVNILTVKNDSSTNNDNYNTIVYNRDFTTDDIGAGLAPAWVENRAYAIMPYVPLIGESSRIRFNPQNATETIAEIKKLFVVSSDFIEAYKDILSE